MPAETQYIPFVIEHPETLLAMLVGLALVVLLAVKFGAPATRTMLTDRAQRIEQNLTSVQNALDDAQRLRNDYVARLQGIEVEQRQRIDAAVREADAARTEIIADAGQTAEALRRRAQEEIARERTRQRIQMRQQIVQISLDAAEHSVRAHTTDTVQRQLIQDFISLAATDGNGSAASGTTTGNGATPRSSETGRS